MQTSKSFFLIFILVSSIHFYLFAYTNVEKKRTYVSSKPASAMVVHKVQIKKEKKVIQKPRKKPIKKKNIKKKIIKKKIPTLKPIPLVKEEPVVEPQSKAVAVKPVKVASFSEKEKQAIENKYLQKVRLMIEKNKFFPKRAKRFNQTGKVLIGFTIQRDGSFFDLKIIKETPYKLLNHSALELFKKILRFEPIPKELRDKDIWEIKIPIAYTIR